MVSASRRDSVGGGSRRIFPWSPKADAIQWGGGSSRIFPWSPKADAILVAKFYFQEGGPGLQKAGSSRNFALMRHFYIFRLSQRGGPGPPPESATACYRSAGAPSSS